MKFTLTIELGNDAMRTPDDLCRAIEGVRRSIDKGADEIVPSGSRAKILDSNGNTVGEWKIEEEKPDLSEKHRRWALGLPPLDKTKIGRP